MSSSEKAIRPCVACARPVEVDDAIHSAYAERVSSLEQTRLDHATLACAVGFALVEASLGRGEEMSRSGPDHAIVHAVRDLRRRAADFSISSPDDIRAAGWAVAVHNDYRLDGIPHTFWLFTRGDECVKGEGRTDAEALELVRVRIWGRKVRDGG